MPDWKHSDAAMPHLTGANHNLRRKLKEEKKGRKRKKHSKNDVIKGTSPKARTK